MDFQYTQEQQQLADSVARLVERGYDFEARKRIVGSATGWSPEVWSSLAEMGLLMIPFAAEDGGFGGGTTDLVATMESIGSGLLVEPFLSTLLAGRLIARAGTASQRAAWLPGVIEGSCRLAFAHAERLSRYNRSHVESRATRKGSGWQLEGEKTTVLHAPMADRLVVSARVSGETTAEQGIALFVVDPRTTGLRMKTLRTVDNLRAADITFEGVQVGADELLGEPGQAVGFIDEALDFATVLACCEAVGAMRFANDATLEYLKTRKQFGVPIGAFQALQHRMVDMRISAEQARSISLLACAKFDAGARGELSEAERRRFVSAAGIKVADACRHVGQESIQLHGGMGMTQEMKVAHTFKRLTMLGQQFGDVDWHLERFAAA